MARIGGRFRLDREWLMDNGTGLGGSDPGSLAPLA